MSEIDRPTMHRVVHSFENREERRLQSYLQARTNLEAIREELLNSGPDLGNDKIHQLMDDESEYRDRIFAYERTHDVADPIFPHPSEADGAVKEGMPFHSRLGNFLVKRIWPM